MSKSPSELKVLSDELRVWIIEMITATAVMILQDEGKLSIDEPVSKYIPQFKDARLGEARPQREISIRDVLRYLVAADMHKRGADTVTATDQTSMDRLFNTPARDSQGNEVGKGDHRHFGVKESSYSFTTPEALIADFQRDIARWNRENSDS